MDFTLVGLWHEMGLLARGVVVEATHDPDAGDVHLGVLGVPDAPHQQFGGPVRGLGHGRRVGGTGQRLEQLAPGQDRTTRIRGCHGLYGA